MARVFVGHSESKDPSYMSLIRSILVQAIRDTRSHDLFLSLDAAVWLCSGDAEIYLDAIGMINADPLTLLTSGRARRMRRL